MIPAVNFHLWEPCNMRCHFCFATFQDVKETILPKGHLPREQAMQLVKQLAQFGFEKITFAGGEPTLCPWLPELIQTAKNEGLTTMVVTNGSNLTDTFLQENQKILDWITLSVDSLCENTNIETGRALRGKRPLTKSNYFELVSKIKSYGYGLKINTVVSSKNVKENMTEFIQYAKPKRWKIFQVLPILGQNDNKVSNMEISIDNFYQFIGRHQFTIKDVVFVPENNDQMKGSYVMVDPAGRFFDNSTGMHIYSKSILEVGCKISISEMKYDFNKFEERGGFYDWKKPIIKSA